MTCSTEGCSRAARYKALELCNLCYQRYRTHASTTTVKKPPGGPRKTPLAPWGERLDALRKAKGVTAKEMCKQTGVDHNTYARILRGEQNIRLMYFIWLAEYYDVALHTLFIRTTPITE